MSETASGRLEAATRTRSFGWQALDSAREQRFTGALVIDVGEEIRLFFDLGTLYLAERVNDPTLPDRLLAVGVVTADDLAIGTVEVGGVAHLGRLFDRAPGVDRDRVVTAIELMNDEVVGSIASREVLAAEALPYRHHPSGVQRWTESADRTDNADRTADTDPSDGADIADDADDTPPAGSAALPPPPPVAAPATLPVPPTTSPPVAGSIDRPSGPVLVPPPAPTTAPPSSTAGSGAAADEPIGDGPTGEARSGLAVASLADAVAAVPTPSEVSAGDVPAAVPSSAVVVDVPRGPAAAAAAVISWDEPADFAEDRGADSGPSVVPPIAQPLIQPLEVPTAPTSPAAPTPRTARPEGMPNLPTGAERRVRRDLAISSDWTAALGFETDAETDIETESTESTGGDSHHDDHDDDHLDQDQDQDAGSGSELSIQIVWPSGDVDPRTAADAPARRPRPVDRPTPGGSARLAVGRSHGVDDRIADDPDSPTAPTAATGATAAAEAVVFEIDWSLGATPAPVRPEDASAEADASDVLDDMMHAVRRTVAACETRVARSQDAPRTEPLGSLARLGGVVPAPTGHSVFDDVMAPSFAVTAGQTGGEDRSGALKRLIGSLKRP